MSKLAALLFSIQRQEVLIPRLREFLAKEQEAIKQKKIPRKAPEMQEADLTIKAFQTRKVEFNHDAEDDDKFADYYHPSAIGGCLRKQWFEALGVPETDTAPDSDALRWQLIFGIGTHVHVLIQNLCERAGVLEAREVPVLSHKHRIIGHADGILRLQGKRYLLEIKTINDRGYSKLAEAKAEHIEQATLYMGLLKLDGVIMLYFNKNTSELKEYRSMFNRSLYENRLLKRVAKFQSCVKQRVMPDREGESMMQFPCTYCAFSRLCWDETRLNQYLKKSKAKRPVRL